MPVENEDACPKAENRKRECEDPQLVVKDCSPEQRNETVIYNDVYSIVSCVKLICEKQKCVGDLVKYLFYHRVDYPIYPCLYFFEINGFRMLSKYEMDDVAEPYLLIESIHIVHSISATKFIMSY